MLWGMASEPVGAAAFPHLFTPITIGGATIRNRILSSGHDTVMAVDGLVTDRLVAYQEARARGGVGLIVIQVAGVHPTARYTSSELTADADAGDPGLRAAGRGHPPPRRDGVRAAVPRRPRDHGHRRRHARRGLGAVGGPDRAVPRDAARDAGRADRGDRGRVRGGGGPARAGRARRRGGRRVARVPAVAVPQPADEPARRRVGRGSRRGGCGSCARRWRRVARRPGRGSWWGCGSRWAR